ncbi:MAG: hypothetical protein ACK5P5_03200 [Pseudobdellovibrionaceae bacterium]
MFKLFSAMTLVIASYLPSAFANENLTVGPLWTCSLQGNLSGYSFSPIISFQQLRGTGVLSCVTAQNERAEYPVILRLGGLGIGLGFSKIDHVAIYSTSFGVAKDPRALIGSYNVGSTAGATLIQAGISFDAALSVKKQGGASFELAFQGQDARGLEVRLQGMVFEIERYGY